MVKSIIGNDMTGCYETAILVAVAMLTALPLYVYESRFKLQPAEPSLGVILCSALDLPVVAAELEPPRVSVLWYPS